MLIIYLRQGPHTKCGCLSNIIEGAQGGVSRHSHSGLALYHTWETQDTPRLLPAIPWHFGIAWKHIKPQHIISDLKKKKKKMHPGRKILCGHLDVTYRSRGHNLASMKACLAISWWETTKSFDLTAGSNDTIRGQKQASVAGGQTARGWVSCRKQVWPERWPRERGGSAWVLGYLMEEQSKSGWLRGPEPKKGTVVGEPCDEGREVWGRRESQQEVGRWAEGSHPLCDKKWGHAAMWGLNALPFIKRSLLKIAAPHENLFQALDYATRKGGPQGDSSTLNRLWQGSLILQFTSGLFR